LRRADVVVGDQHHAVDISLRDRKHDRTDTFGRQRVGRNALCLRIDRFSCRKRPPQGRGELGLDRDDPDPAAKPGGETSDQSSAADRDQQRVDVGQVGVDLAADGALSEQGFGLVERMHGKRTAFPAERFARRQRVGIALARNHQLGRVAPDTFDLRRRSDAGQEDGRGNAEPHRGVGHRHAVIAAGRRNHAACRNRSRQQVGEGAARLERARMLQAFEFQRHRPRREAEILHVDLDDRRIADMRPDQALGFGDALRRDRSVKRHCWPPGKVDIYLGS
jgi:hypothetical protein